MKTLLILRHAKSSWKQPKLPDHDRPLNDRGKRAAKRMAQLIHDEGLCPDRVLSSTATRARRTAEAVSAACSDSRLVLLEELYLASVADYLAALTDHAQESEGVCLVGHNPGLEMLVSQLSRSDHRFPTACLAHFQIENASWSEFADNPRASLVNLWYPRDFDSEP